jgi:hypothetical protein
MTSFATSSASVHSTGSISPPIAAVFISFAEPLQGEYLAGAGRPTQHVAVTLAPQKTEQQTASETSDEAGGVRRTWETCRV